MERWPVASMPMAIKTAQSRDAITADFFIASVEDEVGIGDLVKRAIAPEVEMFIELSGRAADLRRGDLEGAGELAEDGGDPAGGDALDVYFGNGEGQGAFAALAALEGRRIEVEIAPDLGDIDLQLAEAGLDGLRLEAVGVAFAARR